MKQRNFRGPNSIPCLALPIMACLCACGQIGLGGGSSVNEATPSGTVLASGTFETLSAGNAVTGLVEVINSAASGSNVIHFESFSGPTESGLEVRAVVNGTDTRISTLRSTSGNMNYTTTFSGTTPTWSSVSIRSTANDEVYGTAILQ